MQWHNLGSLHTPPPGLSDPPTSASPVAGITVMHHHTQLIFAFFVEMGFHHIGQAGLELLTSSVHFSFPKCWDYRRGPLHLGGSNIYRNIINITKGLLLNWQLKGC